MTDSTDKPTTAPGASGNNTFVIYALCVLAGVALGVVGMMAFKGSVGGDDPVVAEYNGKSVRATEAFAGIKTRLFDLEEELYRTKEQAINEYVEGRLLDAESKKQNMPVEALLEKEAGGATEEVTDKQIEEFLGSKGLSLNDPRIRKTDVADYLKYRQKFEKRQAYVQKLRASSNVKIKMNAPESPKLKVETEGYPTWGNPKAPVTIVEFSDFECPYCSKVGPTLARIKKEYGPDKVKIVFRDMPLVRNHPRAIPAALAAHCAQEQGKFWEMHDVLFQNQQKLQDADLKEHAKAVGMDVEKYTACYDSKRHQTLVDKSMREAETLGIQATPSFVINGTLLQGAQPFERFKEKIDRALKS